MVVAATPAEPEIPMNSQRFGEAGRSSSVRVGNLRDATRAGGQGEAEAVQFQDCGDQAQPQSDAPRLPAPIGAIEAPHDHVALLIADARTGVGDAYNASAIASKQSDLHLAARGRELDRVVH